MGVEILILHSHFGDEMLKSVSSLFESSVNPTIGNLSWRDMFGRPDQIESDGFLRAAYYTHSAPIALFGINLGFHFLGAGYLHHFDSFKHAPFHTGLTTIAFILVDRSLEAALVRVGEVVIFLGIDQGVNYAAAVFTAIAGFLQTRMVLR